MSESSFWLMSRVSDMEKCYVCGIRSTTFILSPNGNVIGTCANHNYRGEGWDLVTRSEALRILAEQDVLRDVHET